MVRLAVICFAVVICAIGAARGLSAVADNEAHRPAPVIEASADGAIAPTPVQPAPESGEASIPKSADGQYWADALVNGQPVHALVDTGASAVALTGDDARRLGLNPDGLTYNYTVMTANGPAHAAAVKLSDVSVGRAQVYNVEAFVIDKGLPTSLLGMTFLSRLSKFEATPEAMILKS
jgi:aspartyl protease family protein